MSLADLSTGLFAYPIIAVVFTSRESSLNCYLAHIGQYLGFLFIMLSFSMLILVAIDRYVYFNRLVRLQRFMTKFQLIRIAIGNFIVTNNIAVVFLLYPSFYLKLILKLLKLILKLLFLGGVFHYVFSGTKKYHSTESFNYQQNGQKSRALANLIRILVATVIVLSMPYNIITSFWTYVFEKDVKPGKYLDIAQHVAHILIFLNMSANAILFSRLNGPSWTYIHKCCFISKMSDNDGNAKGIELTSSSSTLALI